MITFGMIGTGWRSHFYLRVAKACPDRFTCVGVVTRDPQKNAAYGQQYSVPLLSSLDDLLAKKPQFVITCLP